MTRRVRTPVDPAYLRDLFSHSARFYDSVNAITSWGQVGRWRDETIALAAPGPADRVLDAFCGPGGLAERALAKLGRGSELVLADLSPVMLHAARRRLATRSDHPRAPAPRIAYVTGDILRDELDLGTFDVVLLGWGLRYVPDTHAALIRLSDFLRPGGRLAILEFTKPKALSWALPAQLYFRRILPRLGSWLARDRELYEYLRVSSETFLDTPALIKVVSATGLRVVRRRTHLGGLVTILVATRGGGRVDGPPPARVAETSGASCGPPRRTASGLRQSANPWLYNPVSDGPMLPGIYGITDEFPVRFLSRDPYVSGVSML